MGSSIKTLFTPKQALEQLKYMLDHLLGAENVSMCQRSDWIYCGSITIKINDEFVPIILSENGLLTVKDRPSKQVSEFFTKSYLSEFFELVRIRCGIAKDNAEFCERVGQILNMKFLNGHIGGLEYVPQ